MPVTVNPWVPFNMHSTAFWRTVMKVCLKVWGYSSIVNHMETKKGLNCLCQGLYGLRQGFNGIYFYIYLWLYIFYMEFLIMCYIAHFLLTFIYLFS